MASRKKRKKQKKKLLINLSLFLVIIGIVAGITLKSSYFFVESVEISNNNLVSKEEIQEISKVKGKNIFLLNKENTKENILGNPYIESVEITRKLPSKINIKVVEKKIGAAIKLSEGYISVDSKGKMIQIVSEIPKGIPILKNVDVKKYKLNEDVVKDKDKQKALIECLSVLVIDKTKNIFSEIDVSDPFNILFFTSTGIEASIGGYTNLEYKVSLLISTLKEETVKGKKGYIKVLDNGTASFKETS